jgi:hypothetical protein
MRKFGMFMIIFISAFLFMGCETAKPLESVEINDYQSLHKSEHYEVFVRRDMDINKVYLSIGFEIAAKRGTECSVGLAILENYIFLYHDAYYNVLEASQLKIFTGQDLIKIGMDVACK